MKAQLRQAMDYGGPESDCALLMQTLSAIRPRRWPKAKTRLTVRLAKTSRFDDAWYQVMTAVDDILLTAAGARPS